MRIKCKKISPFHWHKILYLGCGLSGEKVATIRKARERTDSTELGLGLGVCVRSLKNKQARQQWKMTDAAGHPSMCSRLSSWAHITKELQDNLTTLVFIWTPCFVFVFCCFYTSECLPSSLSLPLSSSSICVWNQGAHWFYCLRIGWLIPGLDGWHTSSLHTDV